MSATKARARRTRSAPAERSRLPSSARRVVLRAERWIACLRVSSSTPAHGSELGASVCCRERLALAAVSLFFFAVSALLALRLRPVSIATSTMSDKEIQDFKTSLWDPRMKGQRKQMFKVRPASSSARRSN